MLNQARTIKPQRRGIVPMLLACGTLAGIAFGGGDSQATPASLTCAIERALQETHFTVVWQVGVPASGVEGAWQAPNRLHGLRTYFLPGGPRVTARSAAEGDWTLDLNLAELVRGRVARVPGAAQPETHGNRVIYDRGNIVEWYVNDERGLEQGFDIATRPLETEEGPLELHFTTGDQVRVSVIDGGSRLQIFDRQGNSVGVVQGLVAHDAAGRSLPCSFQENGHGTSIRIQDEHAIYPIVVDPTLVGEESWLIATGEPVDAQFGSSIDIFGERAVVGASGGGGGVAYVFEEDAAGNWDFHTKLISGDSDYASEFGLDVAITNSTVFVGAPNDSQFGYRAGAVYVYRIQPGGDITLLDKLSSSTPSSQGHFGHSLDATNLRLVVGAPHEASHGASSAGAVHSFQPFDSSWAHGQRLSPAAPSQDDYFGYAVDIDERELVVGRPGSNHAQSEGSIWHYGFLGTGPWIFTRQMTAPATDNLGAAVSIDDGWVLGGSPGTDFAGRTNCGAVALFEKSGTDWLLRDTQFGVSTENNLGAAVVVDEDASGTVRLALGEPGRDNDLGAVLLYRASGNGMLFERVLSSANYGAGSRFGASVALDDDRLIAGVPFADVGGGRPGRAVAFERISGLWLPNGGMSGRDREPKEHFGYSVAISGDLAVIGVPNDNDRATLGGGAWIFEREDDDWSTSTKIQSGGNAEYLGGFGTAVGTDGVSVVVGAPGERSSEVRCGAAYLFRRDIFGQFGGSARMVPLDPVSGMQFGGAVSISGNRFLIGAPHGGGHLANTGAAYLFELNLFWSQTHKFFDPGAGVLDLYGSALAFDGTDLLIGSQFNDSAASGAGFVDHYQADSSGNFTLGYRYWPSGLPSGARFGASLALSDDRLFVGAPGFQRVYVYERDGGNGFAVADEIVRDRELFGGRIAADGELLAAGAMDYAGAFEKSAGLWVESELRPFGGYFDSQDGETGPVPVAVSGGLVVAGHPLYDLEVEDEGTVVAFRPPTPGPIQLYGFGNGQGAECPCGNESTGEVGCANSTGQGAGLRGVGSASLAVSDLRMDVFGMPSNVPALLLMGDSFSSGTTVGDGLRVAVGQVQRYGSRIASSAGEAEWDLPLDAFSVGQVAYAQVFYRDSNSSPCGGGMNTTNGVQIVFQP